MRFIPKRLRKKLDKRAILGLSLSELIEGVVVVIGVFLLLFLGAKLIQIMFGEAADQYSKASLRALGDVTRKAIDEPVDYILLSTAYYKEEGLVLTAFDSDERAIKVIGAIYRSWYDPRAISDLVINWWNSGPTTEIMIEKPDDCYDTACLCLLKSDYEEVVMCIPFSEKIDFGALSGYSKRGLDDIQPLYMIKEFPFNNIKMLNDYVKALPDMPSDVQERWNVAMRNITEYVEQQLDFGKVNVEDLNYLDQIILKIYNQEYDIGIDSLFVEKEIQSDGTITLVINVFSPELLSRYIQKKEKYKAQGLILLRKKIEDADDDEIDEMYHYYKQIIADYDMKDVVKYVEMEIFLKVAKAQYDARNYKTSAGVYKEIIAYYPDDETVKSGEIRQTVAEIYHDNLKDYKNAYLQYRLLQQEIPDNDALGIDLEFMDKANRLSRSRLISITNERDSATEPVDENGAEESDWESQRWIIEYDGDLKYRYSFIGSIVKNIWSGLVEEYVNNEWTPVSINEKEDIFVYMQVMDDVEENTEHELKGVDEELNREIISVNSVNE